MKNILHTILFTLLLAVACKEQLTEELPIYDSEESECGDEYVDLILLEDKDTKTSINGNSVIWKSGDNVDVNGVSYPVKLSGNIASVRVKRAERYVAFSPAEIIESDMVLIQPAQFYAEGSFGASAYPICAESTSTQLIFKNLFGILELTIKGSETVTSINVEDKAGSSVCGQYKLSNGGLTPQGTVQYDNVTLNCISEAENGVKLSSSGTKFYVVLPARTYSSGLRINISTFSGHSMLIDSDTPRTLSAGHILSTPEIDFQVDKKQIYSYHFDNFVYGSDPVASKGGFLPTDKDNPEPYEICRSITKDINEAGTSYISTDISRNGSQYFSLSQRYVKSRSLDTFTMLGNTVECHGYLGAGISGGNAPNIKLPVFSNLPAGKICTAEISFKMAFQNAHSLSDVSITHTYSTTGKILELWIDGVKLADCTPNGTNPGSMADGTRWTTSQSKDGVEVKYYNTEWVRVKTSDMSDYKWHDVKIVLGAVTPSTVLQISPKLASGTSSAFFMDDIEAYYKDYELRDNCLSWTMLCNPFSANTVQYLKNHGKPLKMGGEQKYVDLVVGDYAMFKVEYGWDDAVISHKMDSVATVIKNAGFKVWNIHLPDTDENGSYETDVFEFFHPNSYVRNAAVERMNQIIKWVKPFHSVNLTIHATGPGRYKYTFDSYKTYGIKSFGSIVSFANSDQMQYPDGTHPVICIENIQNSGTNTTHVCARPEYMNYYCAQVPGLKVCYDSGHSIVGSGMNATNYLKALGHNVASVHMHGNGTVNKDYHLYPGYSNGLFTGSDSYPCGDDKIDWQLLYDILVTDCGYTGPFSYELGVETQDGVVSFNNVAHNFYSFILKKNK